MSHRNIFYYDSRDNLTCVRDPDLGVDVLYPWKGKSSDEMSFPPGEGVRQGGGGGLFPWPCQVGWLFLGWVCSQSRTYLGESASPGGLI